MRVSAETEPLTLDWNAVRTSADRFIVSFLMRGLLKYDAHGALVCDLCRSYRVSEAGKKLVFELNPEERWSDGAPLQAQHFADSFHRLLAPANHFKAAEDFGEVASVRAENSARLEITLSKPRATFAHLLTTAAVYPIRKELVQGGKPSGEAHASTAVLGPYQLAAWERGKRIVIEGNPVYKGDRPVYRVDFVLGTHAQLLDKFKAGKLDILSSPTNEDMIKLPGQRLQVNPYWATRSLVFNVRHGYLSSLKLRQAILHALDREGLPAYLRNGERKATGLIPPGLPGYRELLLATADVALARQEREQVTAGGGKAAKVLQLRLLLRDLDADRKVADWIAAQLEKIQVRMIIQPVSAARYATELEQGHFDLVLTTWAFNTATPLEVLRAFETRSHRNRGGWTHVGYDALLGELLAQSDPAKSAALMDQLTQLIEVKEVAAIPLGYPTQPFLLGARVVSFAITPFGDPDLIKIQLRL